MRPLAASALVLLLAGCAGPVIEEPVDQPASGCVNHSMSAEPRRDADAFDLAVTNDGEIDCVLDGAPAVEVLSVAGEAVSVSPEPTGSADALTLSPGEVAYAVVEIDRGEADCDAGDTGGLRVTLPGTDLPVEVDAPSLLFCPAGDRVLVGSFHPEPLPSQELQTTG
jgi:hypothetical protein